MHPPGRHQGRMREEGRKCFLFKIQGTRTGDGHLGEALRASRGPVEGSMWAGGTDLPLEQALEGRGSQGKSYSVTISLLAVKAGYRIAGFWICGFKPGSVSRLYGLV